MTALRVVGTGVLPHVEPVSADASSEPPVPRERRSVYLDDARVDVDVYDGSALRPGQGIDGPALISEQTTTVLVGASDRLDVDAANNFMIHLGGSDVR
jgi:N-methylhydantoinase A